MTPGPSFEQRPSSKQNTRTVLSEKHRLATDLLQYPHHEVRNWLRERIQSNPVLELESEEEEGDLDELLDELAEILDRELDLPTSPDSLTGSRTRSFDQSMIASLPDQERSLHDHLSFQLSMQDLEAPEKRLARRLIECLDQDGRLEPSLEQLEQEWGVTESRLREGLKRVQSLDPPGVGARDLAESLRLQFDRLDGEHPPEGLLEHLEDLQKGLLSQVAGTLDLTEREVQRWVDRIGELEPHPGRPFRREDVARVTPDVLVRRSEGVWEVELRSTRTPFLGLNGRYKELFLSGEEEVRAYLNEKFNSVVWVLRAVLQREETLDRVCRSIVNHQLDFFESGVRNLRPLVQSTVAEDIGVHESTVSRAVSNKYLQCSRGIFSLEFFFDSGVQADGADVSATSVKQRIRALIDEEDPGSPLSDRTLRHQLAERDGIRLSRRTVAKYRKQMGILSSRMRKRFDGGD